MCVCVCMCACACVCGVCTGVAVNKKKKGSCEVVENNSPSE